MKMNMKKAEQCCHVFPTKWYLFGANKTSRGSVDIHRFGVVYKRHRNTTDRYERKNAVSSIVNRRHRG